MVAHGTTLCSEEPTHPGERVGREQRPDLSLRRGLGLEECIPAVFTAIALALTDSQQNEVYSSAGANAGDSNFCSAASAPSKFCSQQILLPETCAPSNYCSQQFLLPASSALSSGAGGSCGTSSSSETL